MKSILDINELISKTFGFSGGLWLLIGAIVFFLLCLCFLLTARNGLVRARSMFVSFGWLSLAYFLLFGVGVLTSDSPVLKQPLWKPVPPAPYFIGASFLIIVVFVWCFLKRRKRFADRVSATAIRRSAASSGAAKYCYALLFAGMLLSAVLCGLRFGCGDSFIHLVIPMAAVAVVSLLYLLTHWRLWYVLGSVAMLLYAVLSIQAELAETQFSYMPLLALIPLYLAAILPLGALGLQQK